MKKHLIALSALAVSLSALAQDKAGFITTVDSINVYNILLENAPQRPNYKDVPRFTLVGKDSKFYLGMGANVKFVADFDWGAPLSNPNIFAPKDIPMSVDPGDKSQTLFSIGQSNIYWNFVVLPGSKNQLGLFFDINFLGTTSKPEIAIHHAYLKYRGFTAGYIVSTFTDLKAEPAAIDFGGPNAITFVRHPNIYYTAKFGKDKMWTAQLGLDMPDMASFTVTDGIKKINQRMPDIPFFIQRGWAEGKGWLRFSAIFRDLQYRAMDKNKGAFGWGIKASGKSPIAGGLSASWQAVYGKGVSSYIQDLKDEGLDLVPGSDNTLHTIPAWGAYGSLRYDFCKRVFMDFTYSQVRAYARPSAAMTDLGGLYKYGQYVTANLFVNIGDFGQCGLEYLWGRRKDCNGMQNHDNRLMFMLSVSI